MDALQIEQIAKNFSTHQKYEGLFMPSPPVLLEKICELQSKAFQDVEDVVFLLNNYPLIRERILKLANSARYCTMVELKSLNAAILRLGISRILTLIAGISIVQYMDGCRTQPLDKYYRNMWQESLTVAATAYVIAEDKSNVDPEKALLAGLVHNIGILPILMTLDDAPEVYQNNVVMSELANIIIPRHYPLAGRLLLQSWHLPEEIIDISTSHRLVSKTQFDEIHLSDVVRMAFLLSKVKDMNHLCGEAEYVVSMPVFEKFWDSWAAASTEITECFDRIAHVREVITL